MRRWGDYAEVVSCYLLNAVSGFSQLAATNKQNTTPAYRTGTWWYHARERQQEGRGRHSQDLAACKSMKQ